MYLVAVRATAERFPRVYQSLRLALHYCTTIKYFLGGVSGRDVCTRTVLDCFDPLFHYTMFDLFVFCGRDVAVRMVSPAGDQQDYQVALVISS